MTETNINEVLEGHVTLEVECVDRMLLNAYVPNLQVGGQVVLFLTRHLGNPVPSPAATTHYSCTERLFATLLESAQSPSSTWLEPTRRSVLVRASRCLNTNRCLSPVAHPCDTDKLLRRGCRGGDV
ncbi:MAG: hypothetical protein ACYDEY_16355 [Acidimicrobiales bacterium]